VRSLLRFAALAAVLSTTTCNFPNDQGKDIEVVIDASRNSLVPGYQMTVYARAVRVVGTDTVGLPNVHFLWFKDNGNVLVEPECCGYANVTGITAGTVNISARAVSFENAADGTLNLQVRSFFVVDSTRPVSLHYGDILTVYGLGIDGLLSAYLNGAFLVPEPLSAFRDSSSGQSRLSYWVPPPAKTGNLLFNSGRPDAISGGSLTTVIDSADIYEPNDTQPFIVDLDGPGPILFNNPALSFEPQAPDSFGVDWYRFGWSDTTQSLTVVFKAVLSSRDSIQSLLGVLSDSIIYDGFNRLYDLFPPGSTWLLVPGAGFQVCGNVFLGYGQSPPDSVVIAFKTLPSKMVHLFSGFGGGPTAFGGGRYQIAIVRGYRTADPAIGPDEFEENDLCNFADENFARIPIVLTSGSPTINKPSLTIDNPGDVDWYKFRVESALPETVFIATQSRDFDGSDIDLYLIRPSDGFLLGYGYFGGPNDFVSGFDSLGSPTPYVVLDSGDFLLAVVDFAGQATRYSLCLTPSSVGCTPPAPLSAVTATPRVQRDARRPKPPFRYPTTVDRYGDSLRLWRLPSPRP